MFTAWVALKIAVLILQKSGRGCRIPEIMVRVLRFELRASEFQARPSTWLTIYPVYSSNLRCNRGLSFLLNSYTYYANIDDVSDIKVSSSKDHYFSYRDPNDELRLSYFHRKQHTFLCDEGNMWSDICLVSNYHDSHLFEIFYSNNYENMCLL